MMLDTSSKQMTNWERLRNEARQTDQLIDQQLRKLEAAALFDEARFSNADAASPTSAGASAAVPSPLPGGSPGVVHRSSSGTTSPPSSLSLEDVDYHYRSADRETEESLRRLEQTIASMDDACRELGPTSVAARHTERFHGVLAEKQNTRRRLATEFRQRRERVELAASRRAGDARRRGDGEDESGSAGVRILMDEQASIQHTMSRVNGLLEQAEGTRDRLRMQRERFNEMGDKLVLVAERIPFVQNVLRRIDARRRREVVILGSVLSSFMFIFVFFL